ncbi:hypothetical protein J7M23_06945 [Candidatus Sumerlaeota bacterium]|nr:hypothetical protein [Candidatus Sumerlaeota bacterium]
MGKVIDSQKYSNKLPVLRGILFLLSMALFILLLRGYVAFRIDQITQVPMLLKTINPYLFPRDWFLNGEAHYSIRKFFLGFEVFLYSILHRIEWVLFFQYIMYLLAYVGALWAICKRINQDKVFLGIWVLLIATGYKFGTLGGTLTVEPLTIPRIYAYVACFWSIPLIMSGHYLLAGCLLGGSGLFQAAPTLQFLIILVVWHFTFNTHKHTWKQLLLLLIGFILTYSPQVLLLKGLIAQEHKYTPEQVVHYLAYLRHPHHMLPLYFNEKRYWQVLGLLIFLWMVIRHQHLYRIDKRLLSLTGCMIGYFLVSVFFIYVIPVSYWIIFQPFRMFTIYTVLVFFFVALHIYRLLHHDLRPANYRAFLLVFALFKLERHPELFLRLVLLESVLIFMEGRLSRVRFEKFIYWLVFLSIALWYPYGRSRTIGLIALYLLFVHRSEVLTIIQKVWSWITQPKRLSIIALIGDIVFLGLLLFWQFTKWDQDPRQWNALDRLHYRFCMRYQVYPFPNYALELAGKWAEKNTPPDALFLIPPERAQASFHIWSKRSVVFIAKTFPLEQREWAEWTERYLAVRGILDPEKNPEDTQLVLNDRGTLGTERDYSVLNAETLIKIAQRYGADYIVASAQHLRNSDKLRLVAGPFYSLQSRLKSHHHRHSRCLYVYTFSDASE